MTIWPERFVYVLSLTQGAAVNLAPLVQAGLGRVARVEALLGQGRRPADQGEAVRPWRDLKAALALLARRAGVGAPPVGLDQGHSEDMPHWAGRLSRICAEAQAQGLPVLFNITGGTKAMALGGMLGAAGQAHMLLVDGRLQPELVSHAAPAQPLLRLGELDLATLAAAYGLSEVEPQRRQRQEAFIRAEAGPLMALASGLSRHAEAHRDLAIGFERVLFSPRGQIRGMARAPWPPGADVNTLRHLLEPVQGLDGLHATAAGIDFGSERMARLLCQGGWLEADLFIRLEAAVSDQPHTEVFTGLTFREEGDQDRDLEMDAGVISGSRLHMLEAKAGGFRGEKWLQQTQRAKSRLIGPYGRVIAVMPFMDTAYRQRFSARAARAGVALVIGPDAARDAVAQIAAEIGVTAPQPAPAA